MTKMVKLAITLPPEQVAKAKRAVAEGRSASVSGYISEALADYDRDETMADLIRDMIAVGGEPTDEDRAWARRAMGLEP